MQPAETCASELPESQPGHMGAAGAEANVFRFESPTNAIQKWSDERIEEYWTEQARTHGKEPEASWSDVRVIEMELREIIARIADNDRVLDVGCANGFTTLRLAQARKIDIT